MKKIIISIICCLMLSHSKAAKIPVEYMFGPKNQWFQYNTSGNFKDSRFGFFSTSSMNLFYNNYLPNELMSQSYLTYSILPSLKISLGTFYATVPGLNYSANLMYAKSFKDFTLVAALRSDIKNNPSADLMVFAEYKPKINSKVKFYSRFQTMNNYSINQHNRSYRHYKIGLEMSQIQFGLALNSEHYGKEYKSFWLNGLFVKYDF